MKILIFLNSSLTPLPMKKLFWLADLQRDTITLMETVHALVLWDCRFALPAFPSSPCFNTRLEHDMATVKLYLLLQWYCETVGLPYQHSLLPLVSIPGRNMTWLLWNCTYYYDGTVKLYLLLHWYCETVGLPYQHSLLPLVSIPGRNMTWLATVNVCK